MRYLPLSETNRRDMLAQIGVSSVDELFRDLPKKALASASFNLPNTMSEIEVERALGVMAAIYLVEYGRGTFAKVTTFMVDILAGVPSIVAALFVFALWIATLGFPQSAFASYALGIPKWKTIARVVVPTALPGMISGLLLALARVMGETAPVLVLVGYARSINYDPFDGNMASLPLLIYTELTNPESAGRARVWGAALTLILIVGALYVAAAFMNRYLTRNRT